MKRENGILEKLVKRQTIQARSVSGNVVKTAGRYVSLTAPSVDGYEFVCWVYATTNGWTGYVSPSSPVKATTNFYVQYSSSPSTDSGSITGIALYRPISS